MPAKLLSATGKTITSLACLLPIGCSTLPTTPTSNPQPISQEASQNQKPNPLKLKAGISQSVGDVVLNAGVHQGEFPSSYTHVGITASNDLGSLSAWTSRCYTNHGEHAETDHGITGIINIPDTNFSAKLGAVDWLLANNTHTSVGVLGLNYANKDIGFNTGLTSLHADSGGSLYVLPMSQRLTPEGAKIPLFATLKTVYSDGFLGKMHHDFNHLTPGLNAILYKKGPIEVGANVNYQIGFQANDDNPFRYGDSFAYGGLTLCIQSDNLLTE